jgi:hypothetical protein
MTEGFVIEDEDIAIFGVVFYAFAGVDFHALVDVKIFSLAEIGGLARLILLYHSFPPKFGM